jgi:hypothetical protein
MLRAELEPLIQPYEPVLDLSSNKRIAITYTNYPHTQIQTN